MNNRFIGNCASLMKYDLLMQLAKSFDLPIWYVTMLTDPLERNKGDKNATNYRLGSQNESFLTSMKKMFYADEVSMPDICDLVREAGVSIKMVAARNNQKADHYRIGYTTYFTNKDREAYFSGLHDLLGDSRQLIFLDPDSGVLPANKKGSKVQGAGTILCSELKTIVEQMNDESLVMVNQPLNNYLYNQEARIKDVYQQLNANIILLADEVIQTGLYFITKDAAINKSLISRLEYYLSGYRFLKNSQRILLGFNDGDDVLITSIGTFENAE